MFKLIFFNLAFMNNTHPLSKLSFKGTQVALDCSRSFIYALIERGILTPHYILGSRKPYFSIKEIEAALSNAQANTKKPCAI